MSDNDDVFHRLNYFGFGDDESKNCHRHRSRKEYQVTASIINPDDPINNPPVKIIGTASDKQLVPFNNAISDPDHAFDARDHMYVIRKRGRYGFQAILNIADPLPTVSTSNLVTNQIDRPETLVFAAIRAERGGFIRYLDTAEYSLSPGDGRQMVLYAFVELQPEDVVGVYAWTDAENNAIILTA